MPRDISTDEAEVSGRVGLVVFRFSQLDGHSHRFAWQCWDWSHRIGLMITAGVPLEKIWDMIEEGISSREERRHNLLAFQQWRKRAVVLKTQRNDAVHSEWWYKGSTFEIGPMDTTSQRAKKVGGTRSPVFDDWRTDLDALAEAIRDAVNELLDGSHKIFMADERQTFVSPPES